MSKFIKVKNQIINANNLVKIQEPSSISGMDWFIKAELDPKCCEVPVLSVYYDNKEEALKEYNKILEQLC